MSRFLPWRARGLSPLFRLILAWGLLEGVRSGFYAGYLPVYGPSLGIDALVFGLAFTFEQLGDSFGKGIGGFVVQKVGLGAATMLGSAVGLVALLLLPHLHTPLLLWGLSLLWGLGLAAIPPGLMTYSSRIALRGREGRALTLTSALTAPWVGIGWLGIGTLTRYDPRAALWLMAAGQALAFLMGLSLLKSSRQNGSTRRELYPWTRLLLFIPAAFGQTFAPSMVSLLLLPFAQQVGYSPLWLLAFLATGGAVAVGLFGFTGRFADRKSPREPLILGLILLGGVMMGISKAPPPGEALLLAALAGLGFACFIPSWNSLLVRLLPQNNRAAAWGTIMMVESLGYALGPAAGGGLKNLFGYPGPMIAGGLLFFLLGGFYIIALWRPFWHSSGSSS